MNFNCTWEIGVLLHSYGEQISKLNITEYDYEKYRQAEAIDELYAKAIEITCKDNCGLILPIDDAIEWVRGGSIIDYDGIGKFLDANGEEIGSMHCDVDFILKAKENGTCFVAWYNK